MNCDGVRDLLSAYLDGEVSPGELLRVEQHLRRCHACADEVDSLRQTMSLVASLAEVEVPASFHGQLHQRLVALGPPASAAARLRNSEGSRVGNARRWAVPASAAAAVAALAIGLTTMAQVKDIGPNMGIFGPISNISGTPAQNPKDVITSPGLPDTSDPNQVITPSVKVAVPPPVPPVTPLPDPSAAGGDPGKEPAPSPNPGDTKPPSTAIGGTPRTGDPGGATVGGTPAGPKPPVPAKMALASHAKVSADPQKMEDLKAKYLVRQDVPNGIMIVVPAKDHDAVVADVKALWPDAVITHMHHDLGANIKEAEDQLAALRSDLDQMQKMPKSEQQQQEAHISALKSQIEDKKLTLEALNQQVMKAYITIEPTR